MLEILQTIFAGLTLLVFAATAWVALVQLGHLRRSYQMTTASELLENYWTPQFQTWMHLVFFDLEAKLQNAEYREGLRQVPPDKIQHPEIYVCEFYSLIGAYVKAGLMPKDIFLANGSFDTVIAWRRLRDVVTIMRSADSAILFRDFEDVASLCEEYLAAAEGHRRPLEP